MKNQIEIQEMKKNVKEIKVATKANDSEQKLEEMSDPCQWKLLNEQVEQLNAKYQKLEEDMKQMKISAKESQEHVDKVDEIKINSSQTVNEKSPRRKRSQRSANSVSDNWPTIGENMNYLKIFAQKAEECEDKRKRKVEALKRRIKKMTMSGTMSAFIWFVCGLIVIYQGIKCINKYIKSPKGAEIFLVDGANELFPHFTVCGRGKRWNTSLYPDCEKNCMRQGAFWFRNGTIQSIDNFVPNLDFWIKSIYLGYHNENDTETTVTIEHNWWDKHPMKSEFATWKPFIFDLYFGQCYTLQLNQTKKFSSVVLNLNGNRNLQMYAHSPGRIRSIPNPAWYLPNKGTYMYDVQYQLYQMLDNHGEPCNASLHYSPDDCVEEQKFKESMKVVGCTVPFFQNKEHVCTDVEKAREALGIYKRIIPKRNFKNCLQPCNYLKAYLIQSQYNHNAPSEGKKVFFKFGGDGIQVTSAFEAYGELSLFADIGGYVGMFLGLSFSQLTELSNYVLSKLF